MKLKTLEDLPRFQQRTRTGDFEIDDFDDLINGKILKQEAIKWIKEILQFHNPSKFIAEETEKLKDVPFNNHYKKELISKYLFIKGIELDSQLRWIKHFFNLTDEDLK